MSEIVRTADEVEDAMAEMDADAAAGGRSKWPGMNYEQGVEAMGLWLLGQREEKPMDEG